MVSTIKEKVESSYKTNHCFAKFLKKHLLLSTRKENHGKELPREQRFLSCMAFSVYEVIRVAVVCQATRTTL